MIKSMVFTFLLPDGQECIFEHKPHRENVGINTSIDNAYAKAYHVLSPDMSFEEFKEIVYWNCQFPTLEHLENSEANVELSSEVCAQTKNVDVVNESNDIFMAGYNLGFSQGYESGLKSLEGLYDGF